MECDMRKLAAGLVMVAATTLLGLGAVSAQEAGCPESPQVCPPTTLPEVGGTTVVPVTVAPEQPEVDGPEVAGPEVRAVDTLPVTGTDTIVLVGAGVALAAGGGALVLRSKRTADAG